MIKLSRLTDYALVILVDLSGKAELSSAQEIATRTNIPVPTVSKVLKLLSKNDVIISVRGASGGYKLSKTMKEISVASIISAIEGPISLTSCTSDEGDDCNISALCPLSKGWQYVNDTINDTLQSVSIQDLMSQSCDFLSTKGAQ